MAGKTTIGTGKRREVDVGMADEEEDEDEEEEEEQGEGFCNSSTTADDGTIAELTMP